jgi:hypothetical protein
MVESVYWQTLAALFGGGLAGAFFREIAEWPRRPQLELIFAPNDRGCVVDTPATQGARPGRQRYLRLRVRNIGRTTAHDVTVGLTEITFHSEVGNADLFDKEVFELPLSMSQPTQTRFDLPRQGHHFVDIFCVEEFESVPIAMRFSFLRMPARLAARGYGRGSYSLAIFASARNAPSKTGRISWQWNGTVSGLNIVQPRRLGV